MPNTSMPYSDAGYSMGMPQMPSVGPNGFGDSLPSIANHQSMSARTSRSNSLIRPGSGMDENRRSLSALEFQNRGMNFNDFRPEMSNGYPSQQNQNDSMVPGANNHYNYEHQTIANTGMAQNGMPVKTESSDSANYGSALPNADGMSNGQDAWRNGTFNGDSHLMTSSTAGGPYQPKTAGVLTGTI